MADRLMASTLYYSLEAMRRADSLNEEGEAKLQAERAKRQAQGFPVTVRM